jgi:TusA-related sulfurtransferase
MEPGQVLEVLTTDPTAERNFSTALSRGKDRVMEVREHSEHFQLLIRRG